jgi:hypothetical protein
MSGALRSPLSAALAPTTFQIEAVPLRTRPAPSGEWSNGRPC